MITPRLIRLLGLLSGLSLAGLAQADVPSPPPPQFKMPPNPSWGQIEGTVTAKADGKPIAGAEIAFSLPYPGRVEVAKSDDKGAYRSQGLPAGDYQVRCKLAWSYSDYPGLVHVEDHKVATVNCTLPPPRIPVPPPPSSIYTKWLTCKIVNSFRDDNSQLVLFINKGLENQLRVGQDGIIMSGETDVPLEDGGFKIAKVVGKSQSVAHSLRWMPLGRNVRCRINNLSH